MLQHIVRSTHSALGGGGYLRGGLNIIEDSLLRNEKRTGPS